MPYDTHGPAPPMTVGKVPAIRSPQVARHSGGVAKCSMDNRLLLARWEGRLRLRDNLSLSAWKGRSSVGRGRKRPSGRHRRPARPKGKTAIHGPIPVTPAIYGRERVPHTPYT